MSDHEHLPYIAAFSPTLAYVLHVVDGRYVAAWLSENVERVVGYTRAEALRPGWWTDNIHPDDVELAVQGQLTVLQTGSSAQEYRFRHKTLGYRWIHDELRLVRDEAGQPREVVGSWLDVTEAREAAQRLEQSERSLAEAQKVARMGSWEWDIEASTVTWSEGLYHLYGVEPISLVAPDWEIYYKAIHPDDLATAEQAIVEGLAGMPIDYEFRVVRPDGNERIIQAKGEVVRDAGGRPLLVRGTAQDVTERKRLEEALQAQNQRLKELHRLKLDFVSSVSHELRAPITTILGYADFLDEVLAPDQADARAFTNHIRRGARRLQRLVGDLGDFSLLEAGAFVLRCREEDLASCALEAASALGPQLEQARLTLALELPGDLPRIQFDRQRIGQVLANMLENAIRATLPGGRVGLRVFAQPTSLRCEVSDTGRGIDPAEHAKVFQRYAIIGDPANRGSGLGLNISKSLVEAHGGAIGFESEPGRGSTFWFELPL